MTTERNRRASRPVSRSAELFERAEAVLVDGVSSPSRGLLNYRPHPLFMHRGEGGHIIDEDGNRYVDLMLAYGSLIHGHAHPQLTLALRDAAEHGALTATVSEVELEVAERLVEMVPCAERVRFANTGTEACMAVLRLVRAVTGRPKIIKFEGHYHGWSDAFSVSSNLPPPPSALGHPSDPVAIRDSSGLTDGALADTILVPWNDPDRLESALAANRGRVAAIVTEPVMANMGVIPPDPGYLEAVRALADEHDALLYVDETVTGFRLARGGACERFTLRADIVSFGKALGAGFPVAAIAGPAEIMPGFAGGRVLHYGTQNANPALLAVVRESLDMLTPTAMTQLDSLAHQLVEGLRGAIAAAGIPARVQSVGPMLQIYFLRDGPDHDTAIRSYRDFAAHVDTDRFQRFAHALFDEGVYLSPSPALHSVLATVHTQADVDLVTAAARAALERV
jgi:glutamate-1-semialdehyde 2,1-aminomutase